MPINIIYNLIYNPASFRAPLVQQLDVRQVVALKQEVF